MPSLSPDEAVEFACLVIGVLLMLAGSVVIVGAGHRAATRHGKRGGEGLENDA